MRRPVPTPHQVWITAVAVVLVGVTSVVGVRWWLTRAPEPVTVGQAVDRYRSSMATTSTAPPSGALPSPGVYVYATAGHETVDALGGDTHDYPSTTTITVTSTACGFHMTWTPVSGRSDATDVCRTGDGLVTTRTVNTHAFFQISQSETFTCTDQSWWLPPRTSETWTTTCTSDGGRVTTRSARVVGVESMVIGDSSHEVVHVELDDVIAGSSTGTSKTELWLDATTGLLVREISSVSTSNSSAIGDVKFSEQLELRLQSMAPEH